MTLSPHLWSPCGLESESLSGYSVQFQEGSIWWQSGEFTVIEEAHTEARRLQDICAKYNQRKSVRIVRFEYKLIPTRTPATSDQAPSA